MSKETRKDVNKTFRSGEFATSKGLRWTGKGLAKMMVQVEVVERLL